MSKFFIFSGVFSGALTASPSQLIIAFVSIVMTVLTVGYSLWTVRRIIGIYPKFVTDFLLPLLSEALGTVASAVH
jgi:hypothetical protein